MRRELCFLACLGLLAGPGTALAQSDDKTLAAQSAQMDSLATSAGNQRVESRISSDFGAFAGSTANADGLVSGLRSGTAITLSSTDLKGVTTTTTFTPPTGKMGYGNVYTSLALAKYQLASVGITQPTAEQLQAALVGGSVTLPNGQTTTLTGVLTLRADGMGWGQIAQQYGTKLGPVISGMKSANAQVASTAAATKGAAQSSSVTTAAGSNPGQGHGRGITTGAGGAGGQGHGNAYGRGGITTGGGGAPGQSGAAPGRSAGKGN